MIPLIIIGAGGHGKVAAEIAEVLGYGPVTFADARYPEHKMIGRWAVTRRPDDLPEGAAFCAIGANAVRERVSNGLTLISLVHPSAIISPSAAIGEGVMIAAGVIVNAEAQIGRGAILNTGCSVDHDCVLDPFTHISPGARLGGEVHVGGRAWIGIGAVVRHSLTIGADVIVGAGAAVVADVPDMARVGGVPARNI